MVTAAEREADRAVLLAHLAVLADRGHVAPCLTWPLAGWTADDPGEQALAAALCGPCAALTPCRTYGQAHPDEHGTYGALTDLERRPRRKSPTKESNHA